MRINIKQDWEERWIKEWRNKFLAFDCDLNEHIEPKEHIKFISSLLKKRELIIRLELLK